MECNAKLFNWRSFPAIFAKNPPTLLDFGILKYFLPLLLLIAPWVIFLYAAQSTGATNSFVLLLTLAVSAFGFMLLISKDKK